MFKYKCAVSDFADENAYYEAVEKIKNFYPHYEYAEELDGYSRAKTIIVPNKRGKPSTVRVEIDFKNLKTFVISEAYLNYIYDGRKVKSTFDPKEAFIKLIISAAFLVVNIAFMRSMIDTSILFLLMPWLLLLYVFPLALVYFTAAWGMKRAMRISSVAEIFFIELGGLPLVLLSAVTFLGSSDLYSVFITINYIKFILPIAGISSIIAYAVTKSKSK